MIMKFNKGGFLVLSVISVMTFSFSQAAPTRSDWKFDASYNYWSGDYGTNSQTRITYIPFTLSRLFTSRADVSLTVPFINVRGQGADTVVNGPPLLRGRLRANDTHGGLGDIVLAGRYIFIQEGIYPQFRGTAFIKFPTADDDEGLGSGEFDQGFRIEFSRSQTF